MRGPGGQRYRGERPSVQGYDDDAGPNSRHIRHSLPSSDEDIRHADEGVQEQSKSILQREVPLRPGGDGFVPEFAYVPRLPGRTGSEQPSGRSPAPLGRPPPHETTGDHLAHLAVIGFGLSSQKRKESAQEENAIKKSGAVPHFQRSDDLQRSQQFPAVENEN
ncbi:unnamed protein product [Nesidiocoris tenuis]|uniref:Uncharacterized protein n=1 Tax=Nesidiocoris tenuis TaxID=355587 RepID=A0A6H5GX84_9HEMI|nr:unnamed protein product [Nesidiocoris tenuis]